MLQNYATKIKNVATLLRIKYNQCLYIASKSRHSRYNAEMKLQYYIYIYIIFEHYS